MDSSANQFTETRKYNITQNRIRQILSYVLECHKIFLNDGITYSKSEISNSGTVMFEDHLKFEFVEKYLVKNKFLLQSKISQLEEINFACESQQRYIDASDNKLKPDKIDIYINKLGLKNILKEDDENIYFAIECKRIKILSDTKDYVLDIQKYVDRNHINFRLPFEAQIAFIENVNLNHKIISDKVISILKDSIIVTDSFLLPEKLHSSVDGTYSSVHKKNFGSKDSFLIYHLMFDYSKVVLN